MSPYTNIELSEKEIRKAITRKILKINLTKNLNISTVKNLECFMNKLKKKHAK
jgi:fructose/tagatose bisphosphate aldolase